MKKLIATLVISKELDEELYTLEGIDHKGQQFKKVIDDINDFDLSDLFHIINEGLKEEK